MSFSSNHAAQGGAEQGLEPSLSNPGFGGWKVKNQTKNPLKRRCLLGFHCAELLTGDKSLPGGKSPLRARWADI